MCLRFGGELQAAVTNQHGSVRRFARPLDLPLVLHLPDAGNLYGVFLNLLRHLDGPAWSGAVAVFLQVELGIALGNRVASEQLDVYRKLASELAERKGFVGALARRR